MMTSASFAYAKALRTLALLLGLVALTAQGLAPLCLGAAMGAPSSQSSISSIVICTIHGMRTIQIDADGKPVPNNPAPDQQNSTCPICTGFQTASAFGAPAPVQLVAPATFKRLPQIFVSAPAPSQRSHVFYITRAPPASAFVSQA